MEPLVVSWGWQPESSTLLSLDSNGSSPFVLQHEWQGTRDIAAYLSVPAAIEFEAVHDWPQVRQECHELARYARQARGELTGVEQICPDSPEWYAQMATIPLPACDAEELKRRLYDEYRVEVPIIEWNSRQFLRVSVQAYNAKGDLDALISALAALLPQVAC